MAVFPQKRPIFRKNAKFSTQILKAITAVDTTTPFQTKIRTFSEIFSSLYGLPFLPASIFYTYENLVLERFLKLSCLTGQSVLTADLFIAARQVSRDSK
jgi:hypothetical protein